MTAIGPGVRVKCIRRDGWHVTRTGENYAGPQFNTIWTVLCFSPLFGREFIVLQEWQDRSKAFAIAGNFVPLDGNEDISALLEAARKGPVENAEREDEREIVEILIRVGRDLERAG